MKTTEQLLAELFGVEAIGNVDISLRTESTILMRDGSPSFVGGYLTRKGSCSIVAAQSDVLHDISRKFLQGLSVGSLNITAFRLDLMTDRNFNPYWRADLEFKLHPGDESDAILQAYIGI